MKDGHLHAPPTAAAGAGMFVILFRLFLQEIFKHLTTQPAGGRDCRIDPDPKAAPLRRSEGDGPSFRPVPNFEKTIVLQPVDIAFLYGLWRQQ